MMVAGAVLRVTYGLAWLFSPFVLMFTVAGVLESIQRFRRR